MSRELPAGRRSSLIRVSTTVSRVADGFCRINNKHCRSFPRLSNYLFSHRHLSLYIRLTLSPFPILVPCTSYKLLPPDWLVHPFAFFVSPSPRSPFSMRLPLSLSLFFSLSFSFILISVLLFYADRKTEMEYVILSMARSENTYVHSVSPLVPSLANYQRLL